MTSTTADTPAGLAARAAAVIPGGVNSGQRQVPGLEDLVIAGTSGSTFTDANGRVFTDYHAAFGPPLLGHNDPDVDAAAAAVGRVGRPDGRRRHPGRGRARRAARRRVPSLEKVLLTFTGSEATFHALRLARTATGRRHVIKFQGCYHGWHDAVAMNVISPPERVGTKDPLSGGMLPEVIEATIVCPFNDAGGRRARARRARRRRRRDHPRADPAQHRRRAAAARLPRAAARARDQARHRARLRRGDHGLPPRARRLPGRRRGNARPDHARQGDGERLARLGDRRQGRADGSLLDHAGPARLLRRHVQRPPGDERRGARDDREARARARPRARLPRSASAPARASRRSTTASASRPSSPGSAPSSSATSSKGPSSATTTCSGTTSTCSSATAAS